MPENIFDDVMVNLVDYIYGTNVFDDDAINIARYCLMDSIGCAVAAIADEACTNLLATMTLSEMSRGIPVIGHHRPLGPVEAAFHIGSRIRWLEFNDTWLAQEWGHPSDNLGAILAAAAWRGRTEERALRTPMATVLDIMVRTYEIHGVLCLTNCFNKLGIDHIVLVKMASALASARLLGLTRDQALNALSNAIIDGHSLRTYRHAPNAGTRKSWAAGDATARGLQLALFAQAGEMGYPTALTAKKWGFNDAVLRGEPFNISRPLNDFVVKNILFKVPNPAEYHAQTAVEAALRLRPQILAAGHSIDDIESIRVETQRPAVQIIDKTGPLNNPADRDHCMQYMVSVALCTGDLTIADFHEPRASDPAVASLRQKITCTERQDFTKSYYDVEKRAIPNALFIKIRQSSTEFSESIEYPLGHGRRRSECIPFLNTKFKKNLSGTSLHAQASDLARIITTDTGLLDLPVHDFLMMFAEIRATTSSSQ